MAVTEKTAPEPAVMDKDWGWAVMAGAVLVVPETILNVHLTDELLPLAPAVSHAVTVTVELPAVVGVPAMLIL